MKKNLVRCPSCELGGTVQVLGEITEDGAFSIMRFHQAYTKIVGNDFAVLCSSCGEPTYIKKGGENGTNSDRQNTWFYGRIDTWSIGSVNVAGSL